MTLAAVKPFRDWWSGRLASLNGLLGSWTCGGGFLFELGPRGPRTTFYPCRPCQARAPEAVFARRRWKEALGEAPHLTRGLNGETRSSNGRFRPAQAHWVFSQPLPFRERLSSTSPPRAAGPEPSNATGRSAVFVRGRRCRSASFDYCRMRSVAGTIGTSHCPVASATSPRPDRWRYRGRDGCRPG